MIEGHYPVIYYDKHTVEIGETGSRTFHFHIPENATPGVYDLVLSYDGVQQVFSGVLSIGKTKPPIDTTDRHAFSFGYEPFGGFSLVNSYIIMETWVVNEGSPFLYTGCSGGYAPSAVLIHTESGYRIEGIHVTVMNYIEIPIRTGEEGRCNQEFFIPADAPTGDYALELSYGGSSRRFDNVLTVAEPTVEVPGVLYNLTMPIGSDWLFEPLQETYPAGEEVTVRIKFATDMEPLLILNDAFVESKTGGEQLGYWEYSFTMPDQDSAIYFYTYDKTLPYAAMLESCIAWDHYNFSEKEFYYYGEFGNGVMVALLLGNGEQVTGTSVGLYQFITPTTHELLAYYNGGLYWLKIAYEDYELLTEEDLADLFAIHKSLFPDCYDNLPSPK